MIRLLARTTSQVEEKKFQTQKQCLVITNMFLENN
jgi:hypothetical protein